eukprot:gene9385-biopygen7684
MAAPQAPLKWGIGIMLHRRCLPAFHRSHGGQGEATACASRAGNTHSVDALRTRVPALCLQQRTVYRTRRTTAAAATAQGSQGTEASVPRARTWRGKVLRLRETSRGEACT